MCKDPIPIQIQQVNIPARQRGEVHRRDLRLKYKVYNSVLAIRKEAKITVSSELNF